MNRGSAWAERVVAEGWQEALCQLLLEMAWHSWQDRAVPAAPSWQGDEQLKPQELREGEVA